MVKYMDANILDINSHHSLSDGQKSALLNINNLLLDFESRIKTILSSQRFLIPIQTKTKLFSLLDFLNKILISKGSNKEFSYQYFYYYKEFLIKITDFNLIIKYPHLNDIKDSLVSLSKSLEKDFDINDCIDILRSAEVLIEIINKEDLNDFLKKQNYFPSIEKKANDLYTIKKKNIFKSNQTIIESSSDESNEKQEKFSSDVVKNFHIALDFVNVCKEDITYLIETQQLLQDIIKNINHLKKIDNLTQEKIQSVEEEEEEGNQQILFQKKSADKNDNPPVFSGQRDSIFSPERTRSLNSCLINIVEDKDKKFGELQTNLQNTIQAHENKINKLKNHYHKKIDKLNETINILKEENNRITNENDELILLNHQLNEDNRKLKEANPNFEQMLQKIVNDINTNKEATFVEKQDDDLIDSLNQTIELQEIEIQDLDQSNKKLQLKVNQLISQNEKLNNQKTEIEKKFKDDKEFTKREKTLATQISQLDSQNKKCTSEIIKLLKNQSKKISQFNDMIQNKILTKPEDLIQQQIDEYHYMKTYLFKHNMSSIEEIDQIIKERDDLTKQLQKTIKEKNKLLVRLDMQES